MAERKGNFIGRVVAAGLIGGATCLSAYGVLEATSNRSQNQDKPNNPTTAEVIPEESTGYDHKQCKIWTQGEQVIKMSEQDCKDLNICELHSWPTTDGSIGTPFHDLAKTIWDPEKGMCRITTVFYYGAACGECIDKDKAK